jgi:hypothetical protein
VDRHLVGFERLPVLVTASILSGFMPVPGHAQALRVPWINAQVGGEALRESFRTSQLGTLTEWRYRLSLALGIALPLRGWLQPEASFRTTVGADPGFRLGALGLAIRPTRDRRAYGRLSVTRSVRSRLPSCTDSPCAGTEQQRRWGLEAAVGADLLLGEHYTIGPVAWFLETLGPREEHFQYRSVGLGIRLGRQ